MLHGLARRRAEVEVERDAGVELDVLERARERFRRGSQAIAIGVERTGKDQRQAGRAIFEILKCLRVGGGRIGMVDPLKNLPRPRRPPGDRLCPRRARIKRLDAQPVISLADQPLVESGAFERSLDQFAPFRLRSSAGIQRPGEVRQSCGQNGTVGPIRPLS